MEENARLVSLSLSLSLFVFAGLPPIEINKVERKAERGSWSVSETKIFPAARRKTCQSQALKETLGARLEKYWRNLLTNDSLSDHRIGSWASRYRGSFFFIYLFFFYRVWNLRKTGRAAASSLDAITFRFVRSKRERYKSFIRRFHARFRRIACRNFVSAFSEYQTFLSRF